MTPFAAKEIMRQHNVLRYRIDPYFPKYKLAIEVDEQEYKNKGIDYEVEKQKAVEKNIGCEFIRINPAKENFNIFVEISKTQKCITKPTKKLTKESTKEAFLDEFSNNLLRLESKSNNSLKTKCLKYIMKHILPTI